MYLVMGQRHRRNLATGVASGAVGLAVFLIGCGSEPSESATSTSSLAPIPLTQSNPTPAASGTAEAATPGSTVASVPASGQLQRVGGDLRAQVTRRGDEFIFGSCAVTTPLPAGYPDPTPPGAIDVKSYPVVRRAEASGSMNPDLGMNFAFFPLFQHIKKREIAMTSPVEMDYKGLEPGDRDGVDSWTMSFLYRTTDLGPTGEYGDVVVQDLKPITVVSIGGRGNYRIDTVKRHIQTLYAWIDANPAWERAGEPRGLFYNGPEKRSRDKWYEVQVPIRPAAPATPSTQ